MGGNEMNDSKKHTDKIATSILRCEYADYDKNWWHYDREYNMLIKAQTEAFKLANEASEQQDKDAIDTVVKELENTFPTNEQIHDAFNERFPIDIFNATIEQCFKQGLYFSGFNAGIAFMIGRKGGRNEH